MINCYNQSHLVALATPLLGHNSFSGDEDAIWCPIIISSVLLGPLLHGILPGLSEPVYLAIVLSVFPSSMGCQFWKSGYNRFSHGVILSIDEFLVAPLTDGVGVTFLGDEELTALPT